jgi:hypothetical protein
VKRRSFLQMLAAVVVAPFAPKVELPPPVDPELIFPFKTYSATWTVGPSEIGGSIGDLMASTLANVREEITDNLFRRSHYFNLNDPTYGLYSRSKRFRKMRRKAYIRSMTEQ